MNNLRSVILAVISLVLFSSAPTYAQSTSRGAADLVSKSEVYLGPGRNLTACWSGTTAKQECKQFKMPKVVGKVRALKPISTIEGTQLSWLALSGNRASVCALNLAHTKATCSTITSLPQRPGFAKLTVEGSNPIQFIQENNDQMLTSYANARVRVKMLVTTGQRHVLSTASTNDADYCSGERGVENGDVPDDWDDCDDDGGIDPGGGDLGGGAPGDGGGGTTTPPSDPSGGDDPAADYIVRMAKYYACLQNCDTETDMWVQACWNAAVFPKDAEKYKACEAWARSQGEACRSACVF